MVGIQPASPLLDPPEGKRMLDQPGDWHPVPAEDPAAAFIEANLWDRPEPPEEWEMARLSAAVYLYREVRQGWQVVVKFYSVKTGSDASRHADREYRYTQRACEACCNNPDLAAVEPLGVYGGTLFLTYVPGLTLGDLIAVRRSQPGRLLPVLSHSAAFLANLHANTASSDTPPDFGDAYRYFGKLIDNLDRHGVLQDHPAISRGLRSAAGRWADDPAMTTYTPALIHGDATTTNFITPDYEALTIIDWERAKIYDPAADVGRLLAEVAHTITRQGGTYSEAETLLDHIRQTYIEAQPPVVDREAALKRIRFHQASSTLRIARNGWLSRLERTALVAEALALLTV
ncbi:MAG: phosphotransferase [Anaerolineae bacterium]|nr:phosphotransferase [Anaerolineae bacterium]